MLSSISVSSNFCVEACSMIVSGVERTIWSDVEEDAKDWTLRRRDDVV